ncbi:MAG: hemolysin family protein [Nanoarchaeota archaeon]
MLGYLIVLVILIVLSAFFSGIEMAVFSSSRIRLKALAKKDLRARKILKLRNDPRRLLTTILVGNNIVNITSSSIATYLFATMFGSYSIGIATGIMTFLILVFGEITPKSYATQHAEKLALQFSSLLVFFTYLLYPISTIFLKLTIFLSRSKHKQPTATEEEVRVFVAESVRSGEVEKEEKQLIENVFQFNDITVTDVMTRRTEIFCLPYDMKVNDAMDGITQSQFSRIPLFKGTRDNIVGILHVKDVLKYLQHKKKDMSLLDIASKPYFVPKHKVINELFKDFQVRGVHMAIVVDDFGGTSGLVTLEDLIEELVGEITDEFDLERDLIMRLDKNTIKVHFGTTVKEINHFFNVNLPGKKTDTINAFILKRLKKIPKKGESLRIGNVTLVVDEADKNRVEKVIIKKGFPNGRIVESVKALDKVA